MDEQTQSRMCRLKLAEDAHDTTMQWDLIAAAVEQANIEWHGLSGDDAKRMRGRAKVTFLKDNANILKQLDLTDVPEILKLKAQMLQDYADEHTKLGNKLINLARRTKANCRYGESEVQKKTNVHLNALTLS